MSDSAISVNNVSKRYLLRHQMAKQGGYVAFRDVISEKVKSIGRRMLQPTRNEKVKTEEFWALNDVSFEVVPGERVGIIGRNGAGKSTLLKILSRITEPTKGNLRIRGRVASLLEVGTGFHPELTGRENIGLNGAILGMTRVEIQKKFDEIVAFAEVEQFLDTPVKRYSSGMYVRLAFAIAAHLEPEILIIDEVLAVGDADFQKKCLGKMEDVTKNKGRTVLFVSHNMSAVQHLCTSAIWLEKGRLKEQTPDVRRVIGEYMFGKETSECCEWVNPGEKYNNPFFHPSRIYIGDESGAQLTMPVSNDSDFYFYAVGNTERLDSALTIGYAIYNEDGLLLYLSYQTDIQEKLWKKLNKGKNTLRCRIPKGLFNEGLYRLEFVGGLHNREWLFEPNVDAPTVYLRIQGGLSESPYWRGRRRGVLAPVLTWDL